MQLLDCDLAQQAYEERVHKAEQHLLRRYAHGDAAGQAPINRAKAFVKQITGWLWGRPRREVASARRPRTI